MKKLRTIIVVCLLAVCIFCFASCQAPLDGKDGLTPYIGDNGNWWIGSTDTGASAKGPQGETGGNGVSPRIGENGNWYIGNLDTGIPAQGPKGEAGDGGATPYIGANGNWYIGNLDTGIPAQGPKGETGNKGESAYEIYKRYYDYKGTEKQWIDDLVNGRLNTQVKKAQPGQIILNHIYGGGGKGGTPFTHSFIELYNLTGESVNLNGWRIIYSSTRVDSNFAGGTLQLSGTIPSRTSFLIRGMAETTSPDNVKYAIDEFDMDWPAAAIENDAFIHLELFDAENTRFDALSNRTDSPLEGPVPAANSKQRSYRRVDFADTDNNSADFEMLTWNVAAADADFIARYRPRSLADGAWNAYEGLPVLRIELSDAAGGAVGLMDVGRTEYVNSSITLENTASRFAFSRASAQFRGRGHGSWIDIGGTYKRGYRIKFDQKVSLFGFPKSKHWVMLAGTNFDDKTISKNALALGLGRDVLTNIEYSSNSAWTDVYVNGEYRGVYLIAEHVRVDEGRVDIPSEYGVLDTGYLLEYDGYADNPAVYAASPDSFEDSPGAYVPGRPGIDFFRMTNAPGKTNLNHAFSMKSPDPDGVAEGAVTEAVYRQQVAFIQEYVTRAMRAILDKDYATFSELCDVDSFVDIYLLHELFKNTDCGWGSVNFYKKPGGKLYLGAPWDFDATAGKNYGNITSQGLVIGEGPLFYFPPWEMEPQMFRALYATQQFKAKIIARWQTVSPGIKSYTQQFLSDEFIETNKLYFAKNLQKYSFAKDYGPAYADLSYCLTRWPQLVRELKNWLLNRADWLDGQWR